MLCQSNGIAFKLKIANQDSEVNLLKFYMLHISSRWSQCKLYVSGSSLKKASVFH